MESFVSGSTLAVGSIDTVVPLFHATESDEFCEVRIVSLDGVRVAVEDCAFAMAATSPSTAICIHDGIFAMKNF